MFNIKEEQLVLVEWEDIVTHGGWNDPKKVSPALVKQVGFVADIRKEHIVICSGYLDDILCSDPTIIPWSVVKSVTILEDV